MTISRCTPPSDRTRYAILYRLVHAGDMSPKQLAVAGHTNREITYAFHAAATIHPRAAIAGGYSDHTGPLSKY